MPTDYAKLLEGTQLDPAYLVIITQGSMAKFFDQMPDAADQSVQKDLWLCLLKRLHAGELGLVVTTLDTQTGGVDRVD